MQVIRIKRDAQSFFVFFFKFTLRASACSASSRARLMLQESQIASFIAPFVLSWRIYAFTEKILSQGVRPRKLRGKLDSAVERQKNEIEAVRYSWYSRLPRYRAGYSRITGIGRAKWEERRDEREKREKKGAKEERREEERRWWGWRTRL